MTIEATQDVDRTDTQRRKLGTCPGCRAYLWADCIITTTTQRPYWRDDEERPRASVLVDVVAVTLNHDCDKRKADEE